MRLIPAVILILSLFTTTVCAQDINSADSTQKLHSPKRAALYSAVVPGLGQIYNKKYWKLPIIYAGAGAVTYSVIYNSAKYRKYKEAYLIRTDNDSSTVDNYPQFSESYLLSLKSSYQRNTELSYILGGVLYILNIVDAAVDAHLFYFEITEDISMNIRPIATSTYSNNLYNPGLKLTLKF